MPRPRTPGHANKLLNDYEDLNSDLPNDTRRQMAIFALYPLVGTDALEEVFDANLGQTPACQRGWFWWQAFRFSGIPHLWEEFTWLRHNEGMQTAIEWVRENTDLDQYRTLSQRLGQPLRVGRDLIKPSRWSDKPMTAIWTKGGTWYQRDNFTKIIIHGEHLGPREGSYLWGERLGPEGARKIERELHNLIDEDSLLQPQAKFRAVNYVRDRIPEVLGYDRDRASMAGASWFFQQEVQNEAGYFFNIKNDHPHRGRKRTRYGKPVRWDWFWKEEDEE